MDRSYLTMGVDPSPRRVGWAVLDVAKPRSPTYVRSGVIEARGAARPARLASLYAEFVELLRQQPLDSVAFESGGAYRGRSGRRNPDPVLYQAEARGLMMGAAIASHAAIALYAPAAVKQVATGQGQTCKSAVALVMGLRFGRRDLGPDEADALAVAWCHSQVQATREFIRVHALEGGFYGQD